MKRHFCAIILLTLAACSSSGVKETLGFERQAPDEFRVVSRPPLSVPPEFNLRPPSPGDNNIYKTPARDEAKSALMGEASVPKSAEVTDADRAKGAGTAVPVVKAAELPSTADSKFLSNIGSDKADADVRQKLYDESKAPPPAEKETLLDSIWPKKPKTPVVDAKAEAQRLEKNKEENKPVTEGDTPIQPQKDRGVLDRIWNEE